MTFLADFHIHSRFSRATSKTLDLEHLHIAAQCKGLAVVGTGDATHPGWFAEIKEKLVPAGDGLLRLSDSLAQACSTRVPARCRAEVHFLLVSEISNIYKKNGKTRKNHNLVFLPSLDAAERFNRRLDAIGNIRSDGRPILGLDARDLLEILLEVDERAFLVPAHIWTPWFSLLGSKSGFDSLEECFEDLSGHIFAAETGLSSDPAMNRLVSSLDRLTLISNSDAHSAAKLAREANIFHCTPGYSAIRAALEKPQTNQFGGTIEFYPEEGKYHLDGHRKCGVRLTPDETRVLNGICPICGRSLTVGVYNRVQMLADRPPEAIPSWQPPFESLVPLPEVLSELLQVGAATKTVARAYTLALESLGNELHILRDVSPEQLDRTGIPLLGEAIRRMRTGELEIQAGYDGDYGHIQIFSDAEKHILFGQRQLFPGAPTGPSAGDVSSSGDISRSNAGHADINVSPYDDLAPHQTPVFREDRENRDQQQAISHGDGPLLIVAGPGTGKTRTVTHRMAHLIQDGGVPAGAMLALTFTEKAAGEMRSRLEQLLDDASTLPLTATFHALCWALLREETPETPLRIIDEDERLFLLQRTMRRLTGNEKAVTLKPRELLSQMVDAKQQLKGPDAYFESVVADTATSVFARVYTAYQKMLADQHLLDFEDLIFRVVRRLETDDYFRTTCRNRFRYVFVDEYQDLNYGQYRLIRALVPAAGNICVIGDPDQAIYGFRGSDVAFFNQFVEDYPSARVIHLTRNYRSTETILEASWQVIRQRGGPDTGLGVLGSRLFSRLTGAPHVAVVEIPSEKAEAVAVGQIIEKAVGGAGFLAIDAGKVDSSALHDYSFADFAVLYRTSAQADVFSAIFDQAGIPYQIASRRKTYTQPHVVALLALLRIITGMASAHDLNGIARVMKPRLDKAMVMAFLDEMDDRGQTLRQALDQAGPADLKGVALQKRQRLGDALEDLKQWVADLQPLTLEEQIVSISESWTDRLEGHDAARDKDLVADLVRRAQDCQGDSEHFINTVSLQTDADMVQARIEKVTLTTMHAAKGLEFPVVFVVGCEDGLIPLRRDGQGPSDLEEERRLFYVALTRARELLYLTWSRKRRLYGRQEARIVSPFVGDIERHLLKHQSPQLSVTPKAQQVQLRLF
ncbi:MAG: UvrD-helicase domain-containing protein [Desulfobacteraceae bacterium]|nr:UvrD-helicase domain-containing protein [Desulfobacteraceae bacterium]MBC2753094.1 UvrD-helicase domain-containing protein [Desulfobacteraceae bacterium]